MKASSLLEHVKKESKEELEAALKLSRFQARKIIRIIADDLKIVPNSTAWAVSYRELYSLFTDPLGRCELEDLDGMVAALREYDYVVELRVKKRWWWRNQRILVVSGWTKPPVDTSRPYA